MSTLEEIDSIFNTKYFIINKKLLKFAGLWPNESETRKMTKRFLLITLLGISVAPNLNGLRVWCGTDLAICGENIAGTILLTSVFVKYLSTILAKKKLQSVFNLLVSKWLVITSSDEKKILQKYAIQGKYIGMLYICYVFITSVIFSQSCMINPVLDIIFPLNTTRPKILPLKAEFFFDPFENFYKIYFGYCSACVFLSPIFLSVDTMYVAVIYQSLATFSIVQHRITEASKCYCKDKELGYKTIISAIYMHNDALKFLDAINSSYGLCILYLFSVSGVFISLGVIIILENIENLLECLRMTLIMTGVVIHLFFLSWPGQSVLNQSMEMFVHLYKCEWYNMDRRGAFLVRFMMLRSSKISHLSACGICIIGFENCASILKTTLSYSAVAVSLRD